MIEAGLSSVDGESCVRKALSSHNVSCDACAIVAIGKASVAMTQGAVAHFDGRVISGLLIAKELPSDTRLPSTIQCHLGDHPVPGRRSLDAGERLLDYLKDLPASTELVFLISGGASALVEVLPKAISLGQLQQLNRWLLTSGLSIGQMNVLRQGVSCIKAGRLAKYVHAERVTSLLMSDVADNDAAIIGSGLLTATLSHVELDGLPDEIKQICAVQEPKPTLDDKRITAIKQQVVADIDTALDALASTAKKQGYAVHRPNQVMAGDVNDWVDYVVAYLADAPTGLHLWGGETTIELPNKAGRGGRNTHMALTLALRLVGMDDVTIACVATDGDDGSSACAGAIVDGNTLSNKNISVDLAQRSLAAADSATLLEQADCLLKQAKGRSNVADMFLLLKS